MVLVRRTPVNSEPTRAAATGSTVLRHADAECVQQDREVHVVPEEVEELDELDVALPARMDLAPLARQ